MKKVFIMTVALLIMVVFTFSGCDNEDIHTHTWERNNCEDSMICSTCNQENEDASYIHTYDHDHDCMDRICQECGHVLHASVTHIFEGDICSDCGYERCTTCHGEEEISCTLCHGSKHIDCIECEGNHLGECTDCNGEGNTSCDICNGDPYCKDCDNGHVLCNDCDNTGTCPDCYYNEEIYGYSWINCNACNGTAECHDCEGTGYTKCLNCEDGKALCYKCQGTDDECEECFGMSFVICDCMKNGLGFHIECETCSGIGICKECDNETNHFGETNPGYKWTEDSCNKCEATGICPGCLAEMCESCNGELYTCLTCKANESNGYYICKECHGEKIIHTCTHCIDGTMPCPNCEDGIMPCPNCSKDDDD